MNAMKRHTSLQFCSKTNTDRQYKFKNTFGYFVKCVIKTRKLNARDLGSGTERQEWNGNPN